MFKVFVLESRNNNKEDCFCYKPGYLLLTVLVTAVITALSLSYLRLQFSKELNMN